MLGFNHAFRGLFNLVKTERNFKIQLLILFFVILLGFFFHITTAEWIFVIFSSIIALSLEALNSSVEKLTDEVSLQQSPKIKWIKDVSAAAVLIAALGAAIVGCIIFLPYISKLLY